MWPAILEFFTDKAAFSDAFSRGSNWLRGAFVAVGALILSGAFPDITTALGRAGYWGSIVMVVLGAAVKSGDRTPPAAKALASADPDQLKELLAKLGVPQQVAQTAADKTAEQTPAKV